MATPASDLRRSTAPARRRPSLGLRFDTELTTAGLRLVAGVAMVLMWAAGGLALAHPAVVRIALPLAVAYALADLGLVAGLRRSRRPYPRVLTVGLTVGDNAIILFVTAMTGDVSSPVVAILLLVVATNAARFGAALALAVALSDAAALAAVALAFPTPHTSLDHRLHLLAWWAWLVIAGAVITGVIARSALAAERARDQARRQVEADQSLLLAEREARAKLEAEAADRRDFLRVVTHEVRTPVVSLAALTRALSRGGDGLGPAERQEMLDLVASHAEHLQSLMQGIGDLATATTRTRPDRVVLSDLDLLQVVVSAAHAGSVAERLVLELSPEVATVRSDGEKLRRILTNLLENAGRHAHGPIGVSAGIEGDRLVLAVLDRGPGLAPDVAARAFEKGFSFGPERGSSGLGLWIVRELAGVLGGRVWAEPRPGGGLVTRVELPANAGAAGARPADDA